jgi:hypothetical protein
MALPTTTPSHPVNEHSQNSGLYTDGSSRQIFGPSRIITRLPPGRWGCIRGPLTASQLH